jgi:copper resistance protein B
MGIQGIAPYEFEWDSALFVNQHGKVSARVEIEYDLNVTQRLILQPRFEWDVGLSADREVGVGQGSRSTELGLRLRYEIRRELAPYVGVAWQQLYGDTRDIARASRAATSVTSIVAGIRMWF